ncbi:hypothetical protein DICVIV_10670 [Dictyocaulus viviparus]|uniref:Uncharacterized protein n=1 Tax=Dictyocaulus viviparus TaxID=29172 RepID=A0A0D8XLR9_DICVI|nr:hypothetical protein DICVIV_10670 [Dictyocaulus viviparus]
MFVDFVQHFRFLGGQDCPDWLLYQIGEFSKLALCQNSVEFILGNEVPSQDIERFVTEHIETSDVHRLLYSVSYMMKNAASYNCDCKHFEVECSHLGLPPEHSKALARIYAANVDVLKENLRNSISKEPPLECVTLAGGDCTPYLQYVKSGRTTICNLTSGQLSSLRQDMSVIQNTIKMKFDR